MSPGAFLQRPMRWLQAIARYRAARSGGPNFAYELAVDRVAASDRARLDLTAWTAAYNGAEPVRQETLERFADAYAPAGFRRESFRPSYGLAEATLLVTTSRWTADAVSDGIVSCGVAIADTNVRIVDPVSDRPCEEGEIGEIRVAGPGVADGYWSQPDETARTFRSRVEGTPDCWLRTGDLGFSRSGSLYVTGRIKDLLIVRGVKYFPQDLERTAERVHPAVRPGAVAAVAVSTSARGDRVALIAEIDPRHVDVEASGRLIAAIRRAIADRHGLQLHGVALVPAGTVPKTPSGKLRRYLCREAWTDGTLTVIASWRDPAVPGTVEAVRPV
jgi:acyl-CoA synthetase (AMP-forming)/AMP-acid ligase II